MTRDRFWLNVASVAFTVAILAAAVLVLAACTSSGDRYWSQVAGGVKQNVSSPPAR